MTGGRQGAAGGLDLPPSAFRLPPSADVTGVGVSKEALMNRLIRGALAAIVIAALLGTTLWAVAAPRVQFSDTKLKNGMRVIISEDHTAPVFSIAVTYNVGSRNERQGRTGFAHLFEHMMFKGSQNVGSGEHFLLVFNNGGDMNGSTNKDRTNYFER